MFDFSKSKHTPKGVSKNQGSSILPLPAKHQKNVIIFSLSG